MVSYTHEDSCDISCLAGPLYGRRVKGPSVLCPCSVQHAKERCERLQTILLDHRTVPRCSCVSSAVAAMHYNNIIKAAAFV